MGNIGLYKGQKGQEAPNGDLFNAEKKQRYRMSDCSCVENIFTQSLLRRGGGVKASGGAYRESQIGQW